jgi:hypothetical protein
MEYTDRREAEAETRGVVRVAVSGAEIAPSVTRVNMAEATSQLDNAGIIASARNNFGAPVSRLTPDAVVTLPNGMQTSVGAAVQLGYLKETSPGTYAEVLTPHSQAEYQQRATSQVQAQQQAQQEAQESGPVPFSPDVEQALQPFAESVPGHVQDATISALVNGDFNALPKLAQQAGMDPQTFGQYATLAAEAFSDQAARYLDRMGIDGEDFASWAQQAKPNEYREAVLKHIYGRTPSAYRELAREFLSTMAPDGQALRQAGIKVVAGPNGEELVRVGGQLMSIAAAVKAGFL